MKTLAALLSLSLVLGAWPPPEALAAASSAPVELPFVEVSTITVTAPRVREEDPEIRVLKVARAGGAGVGAAGAGLMAYVLILDLTGPFGWAASLIFLGGMTSYLSHRRLQGYDDLAGGKPPFAAGVRPSTAPFSGGAR